MSKSSVKSHNTDKKFLYNKCKDQKVKNKVHFAFATLFWLILYITINMFLGPEDSAVLKMILIEFTRWLVI